MVATAAVPQASAPALQFLDAVSVLHEWDIQLAQALWGAWWGKATAAMAFKELERRSLVYAVSVTKDFKSTCFQQLQTHDVVRSLGYGVLRDPARATYHGSRLWRRHGSEFIDLFKVRDPGDCNSSGLFSSANDESRPIRRSGARRWWLPRLSTHTRRQPCTTWTLGTCGCCEFMATR
jgi:hypothetical protein